MTLLSRADKSVAQAKQELNTVLIQVMEQGTAGILEIWTRQLDF